jgi:hypothetical protein
MSSKPPQQQQITNERRNDLVHTLGAKIRFVNTPPLNDVPA